MWLPGQVEVPEPVLLAQQQGRLVVFVGAGASVGPPSQLPPFVPLAKKIATNAHMAVIHEVEDHPDLFLGGLEDGGARASTSEGLVELSPQPNRLHEALVRLSHRSTNCASSRRTTTST